MSANQRLEERSSLSLQFSPVNCTLSCGSERTPLEVVNYHHRGACFRTTVNDYRIQEKDASLHFRIGNKELTEKITFRLVWETISENGLFGVEFSVDSSFVLARAERFITHGMNTPHVSVKDPLDPNREIYFKVLNISAAGMLLNTSLSNKHLFPGMELNQACLEFANIGKVVVNLFIENSRPSVSDQTVFYGVSVKGQSSEFERLSSIYLSNLGLVGADADRLEKLSKAGMIHKDLRRHLTIREVTTQKDYDEVLKLRFDGYKRAGKTKAGIGWEQMGEGFGAEGVILAAFLGGQIIASVELRFTTMHKLRLADQLDFSTPLLNGKNHVEINKLVVHPNAQKTDVVVGLFQKIHALTMLNGKPDGLLIAEDKLVPLYERLGAKKIGVTFPHAIKADANLHVMIIPRETYEEGAEINPLAWSTVYNETHSFLNHIGLSENKKFTVWQKTLIQFSRLVLWVKEKRKGKRSGSSRLMTDVILQHDQSRNGHNIIDPKWTQQHLHASVLLPYLLVADEKIGKEKTSKIVNELGFSREYFSSSSNWISIAYFNYFIEKYKSFGSVDELQKMAGYRNFSKEVLGVNHFLLKHFLSPAHAFSAFGSYMPKFNKTRTYQVVNSGSTFSHIRIGLVDKSLIPADPSAIHNWLAILDAHVLVTTGRNAKIQQIKSIFDGDQFCEYLVQWRNPLLSTRNFLLLLFPFGVFGLARWAVELSDLPVTSAKLGVGVAIVYAVGLLLKAYHDANQKYHSMITSLTVFQKDADERYRELQTSKSILEKGYQEGKILETISKEIQTSEDLHKILGISLDAVCGHFDFHRAFVMIVDAEGKYLETSAFRGATEAADDIWKFKVDVSKKRDNPVVISSVFHTGQSILISDIESHKFHLNENSKALIERLKTNGFAIVPIPSKGANWGVLLADKGESRDVISRRDLVALQRVCQAIGLALDKQAKIESEVRIRKIFQKYVPSAVIESTLGIQEPTLGGEIREVVCLFFDIRNFTSLSNQVPAGILVGLLNEIFNLLHLAVSESGGVIDKFLGDGALVTWGSVPGSELAPEKILRSSETFLKSMDTWNEGLKDRGIVRIDVGIGIHRGQVISGNIGSQDRMEFTVIGPTVNMASRLEGLNKVFGCNIVISDKVIDFAQLSSAWVVREDVQVRGVDETIRVATLNWKSLEEKKDEVA